MTAPADLALSGLTKSYGDANAVDRVTLRIAAGELVALLGPSGCGKTTTLRMIAGLVEPTEGDILIGDARVTHVPSHRRNIGMLFQNYALFPHLTVAENVAFGLKMRGLRKGEIKKKVDEALATVQLSSFAGRSPAALSGGQQQRVALARAIVIEPSLLLLDEPLGALDKNLRESMQVELRRIQKRLGITAVLVTHDQEEALTMADRIVIMRGGKLEQVGTPEEVYSRPVNRFVANFIGAANILRGNVIGKEAGNVVVRLTCGGRVRLPSVDAPEGDVLICVRPEAIVLSRALQSGNEVDNGADATIEQIAYRGQVTHVHLRLDDGEPLLGFLPNPSAAPNLDKLSIGDRVSAAWKSNNNCVVADA